MMTHFDIFTELSSGLWPLANSELSHYSSSRSQTFRKSSSNIAKSDSSSQRPSGSSQTWWSWILGRICYRWEMTITSSSQWLPYIWPKIENIDFIRSTINLLVAKWFFIDQWSPGVGQIMSPHHFGQMSQRSYPGVIKFKIWNLSCFLPGSPNGGVASHESLDATESLRFGGNIEPICLCFKARTQPRFPTHTKKGFFMLIYMNLISLKSSNSQVYSNFFNASKVLAVRSVWGKASLWAWTPHALLSSFSSTAIV